MQIESKRYQEGGLEIVEDICPEGYVVVDEYTPCHSVTPWDYYGMNHQRQYCKALRAAGVEPICLETRRRILHPSGSGPRGMVRFGDDMCPHIYKIAVAVADQDKANAAMAAHQAAVKAWLEDSSKPVPEALRD